MSHAKAFLISGVTVLAVLFFVGRVPQLKAIVLPSGA